MNSVLNPSIVVYTDRTSLIAGKYLVILMYLAAP